MSSLDAVPNEILEHIAFYSGTEELLGPPSSLPILLTLSRKINGALSTATTPHLYARIFAAKFDLAAPLRRLGPSALTASALMGELRSRCIVLKRIRAAKDCLEDKSPGIANGEDMLDDVLSTAYFMMLENDGKNAAQLKDYAHIKSWLTKYWLDPGGRSLSVPLLERAHWPKNDNRAALGMWLLWFFFDPGKYIEDVDMKRKVSVVIKTFTIGAHRYPISAVHWTDFFAAQTADIFASNFDAITSVNDPRPSTGRVIERDARGPRRPITIPFRHFSLENIYFSPPPAALPAIVCYLALCAKEEQVLPTLLEIAGLHDGIPGYHNIAVGSDAFLASLDDEDSSKQSFRWDCQWYRCLAFGGGVEQVFRAGGNTALDAEGLWKTGTYRLGSIEGFWEGVFSYTEFTSYASLLTGAPPQTLHSSLIAKHNQTWKLREYHLLADVPYSSDAPGPSRSSPKSHVPSGMPVVDPFPSTDQQQQQHEGQRLQPKPLPVGEALRAHLPPSSVLTITELADTLKFVLPESYESPPSGMTPFTTESSESADRPGQGFHSNSKKVEYVYHRYRPENEKRVGVEGDVSYAARVKDIIIVGEGHSSWGEFKLLGRIRAFDGLVCLSKEYTEGDRGRWCYRGYLVGAGAGAAAIGAGGGSGANSAAYSGAGAGAAPSPSNCAPAPGSTDGHLVGRWRDTLSPINTDGYEGCFGLTRRR
ncbi:hypothetical protein SCHPADRAFT_937878 [Schizopora paradoxa]|uniref:F-box domain-containing protein n=1 Tax=Schizopora paradoxa TaxID=27342 RepID=A0A0H2SHK9_9AGAM|nr:hypothetical protein SCHPADRAFT_937878 [Schizopora paradoxa]